MDPLIKLAVDIKNAEAIKNLTNDLASQKAMVAQLNAQLAAGAINQKQYMMQVANVGVMAEKTTRQLESMGGSASHAGRGLLQLGYAIDDVQYGFSAIVNNIPQIVLGLGGSAGIAGGVAIATVAVNLLVNHWGQLTDKLNSWTSDKTVEQLDRMRTKAEEVAASFERMSKAKTHAEKKETAEREEQIVEGPFNETRARVMAGLLASKNKKVQASIEAEYRTDAKTGLRTETKGRVEKAEEQAERIMGGGAKNQAEKNILAGAMAQAARKLAKPGIDKENAELNAEMNKTFEKEAQRQRDEQNKPLSQRRPEEYQQMLNERAARHESNRFENLPIAQRFPEEHQRLMQERANRHAIAEQDARESNNAARQLMMGPLGRKALAGGPMGSSVFKALATSGAPTSMTTDVKNTMQAMATKSIEERMRETGVSRARAKQELMLENVQRNNPDFGKPGKPSEMTGLGEFWTKLQTGSLDVSQKQLTAVGETNRLLGILVGKTNVAPAPTMR